MAIRRVTSCFVGHRSDKRRRRFVEAAAAHAAAATSRRHRRQVLLRRSNRSGLVQGRRVLRRAGSRVGAPRLHAKAAWSGRSPRIQPHGSGERYVSFDLRMGNLCDIDNIVFCVNRDFHGNLRVYSTRRVSRRFPPRTARLPGCAARPMRRPMRRHRARRDARLWPRRG